MAEYIIPGGEALHLNPNMRPRALYELFNEVAYTHPSVMRPVEALLGDHADGEGFENAEEEELKDVTALLEAVLEAWSARNDVAFEDAPRVIDELNRQRTRKEAKRLLDAEEAEDTEPRERLYAGGDAILDQPAGIPAVWGRDDEILWSEGEPFLLVAPAGVGKTTVMGQITAGLAGIIPTVLGWPVTEAERILYVAADRPRQIKRSLRRHFTDAHRDTLNKRLVLWEGPPPVDLAKHPEALTELCQRVDASHVILDSLKDMAVGLTDDEVGSGLNRAMQLAIAEGIEVAGTHHQRKGQGGTKPKTLEDVYGSTWITAGAGSVVLLWGQAGDLVVELVHLKQPATPVGPLKIEHDHDRGLSSVFRGLDVLALLRNRGRLTAPDLARVMFGTSNGKVSDDQRLKASRKLKRLVSSRLAVVISEPSSDGHGSTGTVYGPTADPLISTDASTDAAISDETTVDPPQPPTPNSKSAGQSTDASTDATDAASHRRSPPLVVGGEQVADGLLPTESALQQEQQPTADKARMARARRAAGQPLSEADQQALELHEGERHAD